MTSQQNMSPGSAASARQGKTNPIRSEDPILDPYPSLRFSQIVASVKKMKHLDERSAFLFLASVQKIRESGNSRNEMEALFEITSCIECDTPQNARFYINFYNSLFDNRMFRLDWISIRMFETLQDTLDYIGTNSSGDAIPNSMDTLSNIAKSNNFIPQMVNHACRISRWTKGYGAYFGLRMMESMISNPNTNLSWFDNKDNVMQIADFANQLNLFKQSGKKFDFFDTICTYLSETTDPFSADSLNAILEQTRNSM